MTEQHTEAHRPHLTRRRRLLPLGALVVCVVAAALVGALRGGPVSAGRPTGGKAGPLHQVTRQAHQAANRQTRVRAACMPHYPASHGAASPWTGSRRRASEAVFDQHIAREDSHFVRGRHGWVFFSDKYDENFSQALGRSTQSRSREAAWAKYLAKTQKAVAATGADFHVVISPANWDVYHQALPAWAQGLRGETSLERLVQDYPKLPWIDTRQPLTKAGKKHATYAPLDSHWTPYGGWVAWQAITKCLRASDPALAAAREPGISGVGTEKNSNEFSSYGVPDGKPVTTYPIFATPHPSTTLTHIPDGAPVPTYPDGSIDEVYAPYRAVTPQALSPASLLVLRDSTGNALSPLQDWTFATTVGYTHGIGQPGQSPPDIPSLVQTYHPNVVLYVITERFLTYAPPAK